MLDYMMVLTGPNHSGKSVYLKQVALIYLFFWVLTFLLIRSLSRPKMMRTMKTVGRRRDR